MREDDGVGLGVGQIERSADGVAKLVVKRHPDRTEAASAKPGAVKRIRARRKVAGVGI